MTSENIPPQEDIRKLLPQDSKQVDLSQAHFLEEIQHDEEDLDVTGIVAVDSQTIERQEEIRMIFQKAQTTLRRILRKIFR